MYITYSVHKYTFTFTHMHTHIHSGTFIHTDMLRHIHTCAQRCAHYTQAHIQTCTLKVCFIHVEFMKKKYTVQCGLPKPVQAAEEDTGFR